MGRTASVSHKDASRGFLLAFFTAVDRSSGAGSGGVRRRAGQPKGARTQEALIEINFFKKTPRRHTDDMDLALVNHLHFGALLEP